MLRVTEEKKQRFAKRKGLRSAVSYYLVRGEIRNNTANGDGGGVFVANNSAIEMTGGEMRENETKANGGGVFVATYSAFTMAGGKIVNNTANDGGGVLAYVNSSILFKGGIISYNTANASGGGVFINNNCLFEMTDGDISNNTANGFGGGVYVYGSTFEMTGGEIANNTASYGGGVFVTNYSNLVLTGGEIASNTSTYGGGVFVNTNCTFGMTGGEIKNNTANIRGGGVCEGSNTGTSFTMFRGEVPPTVVGGIALNKSARRAFARRAPRARKSGRAKNRITNFCINFTFLANNISMIKANLTISSVKERVNSFYLKPITVKLNLGRNKFITFTATLNGVYPSLFTVCPDDKNFLGKTAYSYSEILCGRVKIEARAAE